MDEWKVGTLKEIAEIEMGQSPSGDTCNSVGLGIPLLNGPTEFGIKNPFAVQYTIDAKRLSNPNDILFCVRGSTTGKMNWSDKVYAIGRGLASIKHKNGEDYRYFIRAIIDHNLELLLASATGSTFPNVSRNQLEELEILIPPLPEQTAIASILSSLDDKIDLLHRQNATLEKMAETLFRQWFIEEAKEEWEMGRISDLIEFNPQRRIPKGAICPYLEMAELNTTAYAPSGWYLRAFVSGSKFINGDTLLARITPCLENGKAAFVDFLSEDETGWGSTEFIVLRPKNNIHPFFAYAIARNKDFKEFAESCMQGSSGRQRVDIENLKSYEIGIPTDDVVERYNKFCTSVTPKLKSNQTQIRTLTALRDTLLPKLMSGEVKVEK